MMPKICARLQKIASNFSKFSGGGPQTPHRRSVRGFAPLPPPLPKFLDPSLTRSRLLYFTLPASSELTVIASVSTIVQAAESSSH